MKKNVRVMNLKQYCIYTGTLILIIVNFIQICHRSLDNTISQCILYI